MQFLYIFLLVLLGILLLCLFAIHPRIPRDGMREMIVGHRYFAHRGLHGGDIPENSLPAFARAAEAGYGIELDVQITSDGVPVVFHDDTLTRMCGREGGVYDLTLAELQALSLGGHEGICPPTFAEVLQTVAGRVPLIVEIKASLPEWKQTLEAAVALLDDYDGPYCIESFNPLVLRWLKRRRPSVLRGQLCARYHAWKVKRTFPQVLAEWFLTNILSRPDFVAYDFEHIHTAPFRILSHLFPECVYAAWTPRSPEDEAAAGKVFDIMIFENYLPKEPTKEQTPAQN